jgi:hypothetical protein
MKLQLSSSDISDIRDHFRLETLPWVYDRCIPFMKDISGSDPHFSKIWEDRQESLYLEALKLLEKDLQKAIQKASS